MPPKMTPLTLGTIAIICSTTCRRRVKWSQQSQRQSCPKSRQARLIIWDPAEIEMASSTISCQTRLVSPWTPPNSKWVSLLSHLHLEKVQTRRRHKVYITGLSARPDLRAQRWETSQKQRIHQWKSIMNNLSASQSRARLKISGL